MPHNWKKEYSELKEYVVNNPQIKISRKVITIPGDVRPEFFRLFDKTRVAFLKEKCQTLLNEATLLSSNYVRAAQDIKKSLGLSEIKLPAGLNWFLNDPVNGLIRSIYDLLFNLLEGEIDIDTFECEATESIESSFRQYFKSGYKKWVVLSLFNLLNPDRALVPPDSEIEAACRELEPDEKTGSFEAPFPNPEDTQLLSFKRVREPEFIVPNLIIHSAILNRYISIGTDLLFPNWSAKETSKKREWCQIRDMGQMIEPKVNWPDLVIYVDDQPKDIALVADFSRFCRPDIIVECMEQVDWYQKGGLDKVRQHYNFLKPRLGSYVVSRLPVPEEALKDLMPEPAASEQTPEQKTPPEEGSKEQPRDIHIITVGYDQSKMKPIINIMMAQEDKD